MLTYVLRRLLYSILVLVLASMIIFTFVSVSGDPLGYLRTRPNISQQTIHNIEQRNHLNDSVPVRYGYWVRDAFTNEFGTSLVGNRPILPDLLRVMSHTVNARVLAVPRRQPRADRERRRRIGKDRRTEEHRHARHRRPTCRDHRRADAEPDSARGGHRRGRAARVRRLTGIARFEPYSLA